MKEKNEQPFYYKSNDVPNRLKEDIIEHMAGTSNDESEAEDRFNVSHEAILDIMVEASYERCSNCSFWLENCELEEDEHGAGYECKDCSPELFDEEE